MQTESMLMSLERKLNNSYFTELTQLENDDIECKYKFPVQWSSKSPALGNETKNIHLKVLNSWEHRRRNCISDILSVAVRHNLDREESYPGDELFPPEMRNPNKYHYRFYVAAVSPNVYLILDGMQHTRIFVQHEFFEDLQVSVSGWYAARCREYFNMPRVKGKMKNNMFLGNMYARPAIIALNHGAPYPGEDYLYDLDQDEGIEQFNCWIDKDSPSGDYIVHDTDRKFKVQVPLVYLKNPWFNIAGWYARQIAIAFNYLNTEMFIDHDEEDYFGPLYRPRPPPEESEIMYQINSIGDMVRASEHAELQEFPDHYVVTSLHGQQVAQGTYPSIQRNSMARHNPVQVIPKPIVVVVKINGHPARALVDSGSLGDFMSSTLAEQLHVEKDEFEAPVMVQLAVQGSRSKSNYNAKVQFEYQMINEKRNFDVINLTNYDLILGTPWMYQHQVSIGLHPIHVIIGSNEPLPMKGPAVAKLSTGAMTMVQENLQCIREDLVEYAKPLCIDEKTAPLPPLRKINHRIPIIDSNKAYKYRPSHCPDALKPLWNEKRDAYLKSGRWHPTTSFNTTPMLFLRKPGKPGEPIRLRCVNDL